MISIATICAQNLCTMVFDQEKKKPFHPTSEQNICWKVASNLRQIEINEMQCTDVLISPTVKEYCDSPSLTSFHGR